MINSSIKRFKSYLKEAYLDSTQRSGFVDFAYSKGVHLNHYLDKPSEKAEEISGKAMPETIRIPMMSSTMQAVHDHLKNNGYTEVDYGNKVAHKDIINQMGVSQRITTNIGKALTKTKADQSLINSFNNDNHKEAADLASKHDVIISRVPKHIAACSTNTPWDSCAKLTSDGYPSVSTNKGWGDPEDDYNDEYVPPHKVNPNYAAAKLPLEIKHGTHVAYMVPNVNHPANKHLQGYSDNDLIEDYASARILLKPFTNNDTGHTILRPESKGYIKGHTDGKQVPQGFKDTVRGFADEKFPAKHNTLYRKNSELYDDDHKNNFVKLDINKPFDKWNYLSNDQKESAVKQSNMSSQDITNFIDKHLQGEKSENSDILGHLPHATNFTSKHLDKLYHPDILKHISDPVSHNLLIDKANSKQYDTIFDHVINHGDSYYSYSRLADNPNFSEKHIHKAISSNLLKSNNSFAGSVLQHPKLSGDLLTSMVNLSTKDQTYNPVIANPNLTSEHISTILDNADKYPGYRYDTSLSHMLEVNKHKLTADHIDTLINHYNSDDKKGIRYDHITTALHSPNVNLQHLAKLPNEDKFKAAILYSKNAPHEVKNKIIDDMLNSGNYNELYTAVKSHTLSTDHISKITSNLNAIKSLHHNVDTIIEQPNFNDEHFKNIMHPDKFNDYSEDTRNALKYHLLNHPDKMDKFVNNIPSYSSSYKPLLFDSVSYRNMFSNFHNGIKFMKPEVITRLHPEDRKELLNHIGERRHVFENSISRGWDYYVDDLAKLNAAQEKLKGVKFND